MATGTKYSSTVQRVVAHFQPSINLDGLNSGLDDFADRSISMLFSISLVGEMGWMIGSFAEEAECRLRAVNKYFLVPVLLT